MTAGQLGARTLPGVHRADGGKGAVRAANLDLPLKSPAFALAAEPKTGENQLSVVGE